MRRTLEARSAVRSNPDATEQSRVALGSALHFCRSARYDWRPAGDSGIDTNATEATGRRLAAPRSTARGRVCPAVSTGALWAGFRLGPAILGRVEARAPRPVYDCGKPNSARTITRFVRR